MHTHAYEHINTLVKSVYYFLQYIKLLYLSTTCRKYMHATLYGNHFYASGSDCILNNFVCIFNGVKRNTSKMC